MAFHDLFKVGLRFAGRDGGNFAPLRSAVAHSKIVLQMTESLECCAVPFRQAGLGFIGCLEEIEENIVR
jgi:hypothetical protein